MTRTLGTLAALALMALPLLACNAPITSPGPGWPRNGDGVPVDKIYGTPLPGRPSVY